jgi:hypothetical protein
MKGLGNILLPNIDNKIHYAYYTVYTYQAQTLTRTWTQRHDTDTPTLLM